MTTPLIFLIAGEPSGDFLGSQLMRALKSEFADDVQFAGVGGPLMIAEGMKSLFPMEELSLLGITEILPHVFHILKRVRQTVDSIAALNPNVVITIDSPAFNFRVGKAMKKRLGQAIPLVHYTAPSVWAWRPRRAKMIAKFVDHLLTLFPFEPSYFHKEGVAATFVGHPIVEIPFVDDLSFRARHGINPNADILCVLPGSRSSEIQRLAPIFAEAIGLLSSKLSEKPLHVVVPTFERFIPDLKQFFSDLPLPITFLTDMSEKFAVFKESQVALAASGTVALELAAASLPMVVAYRLSALTYYIVKRMVKVNYACLINILLDQPVVPELLQQECQAEKIAGAIASLLASKERRQTMQDQLQQAIALLSPPHSLKPSSYAAKVIKKLMDPSVCSES